MNVLVIDIGGNNVKMIASGEAEPRKFPSGPQLTPEQMVAGVKEFSAGWAYEAVSIGYPGVIKRGRIVAEPHNLGGGWVNYDFAAAFGCPIKLINDAAMQALGSYRGENLLFLGLGTGLGSALVIEGTVVPMELGHMTYKKATYEDYVGVTGLTRLGKKKWRRHVAYGVPKIIAALVPDDVVIGGGNARYLTELPPRCRMGENANAFIGGYRMWEEEYIAKIPTHTGGGVEVTTPPLPPGPQGSGPVQTTG